MNNKRINRISEEVKRVVSELIRNGLKDPRVNSMTTITKTEVTRDLSFANIYVSVLGNDKDKEDTITGLNNAKGFIRNEIARKIDLRYSPEPIFHLDESIEQGIYLSKLIDEVNKKDSNNSNNKEDKDE